MPPTTASARGREAEADMSYDAHFRVWRGDDGRRRARRLHRRGERGRGRPRHHPPAAGHPGRRPGGALELQGRQVRLVQRRDQRQAAAAVHDPDVDLRRGRDDHRHAAARVPGHQGPRHRRLLQLREGPADPGVRAAGRPRPGRVPDAAGRRRALAGVPQVHRVLPLPGHLPRRPRPRGQQGGLRRPPVPHPRRRARHAPARRAATARTFAQDDQGLGMCNITKCCTEVCPEHIKITDNAHHPDEGARRRPQVRPARLARHKITRRR